MKAISLLANHFTFSFPERVCSGAQSGPTLCDPMDCSPQSSFVHGIFQARILKHITVSYSTVLPRIEVITDFSTSWTLPLPIYHLSFPWAQWINYLISAWKHPSWALPTTSSCSPQPVNGVLSYLSCQTFFPAESLRKHFFLLAPTGQICINLSIKINRESNWVTCRLK